MVRGTFSPARAWRPAVVARLARTLGVTNRMRRTLAVTIAALIALVFAAVALILFLHSGRPKSYRYLIPSDYVGWLCLSHSSPSASPLPVADGFRIVKFDRTGFVETSDEPMPSQSLEQFVWYSSQGTTPLDVGTELGGGYTTWSNKPGDSGRILFWVSKPPRPTAPAPDWKKPYQCE